MDTKRLLITSQKQLSLNCHTVRLYTLSVHVLEMPPGEMEVFDTPSSADVWAVARRANTV